MYLMYCIYRNFTRRKCSPISPSALIGEILSRKFLSCVNDYVEDMVTFTTLVKIYSTKYFCNTKVAGLGEIFVKRKFSRIRYTCTLASFPSHTPILHVTFFPESWVYPLYEILCMCVHVTCMLLACLFVNTPVT